jgi:hypothetical protein
MFALRAHGGRAARGPSEELEWLTEVTTEDGRGLLQKACPLKLNLLKPVGLVEILFEKPQATPDHSPSLIDKRSLTACLIVG